MFPFKFFNPQEKSHELSQTSSVKINETLNNQTANYCKNCRNPLVNQKIELKKEEMMFFFGKTNWLYEQIYNFYLWRKKN